ncbi:MULTISPECIES: DUF58 domain-containing protein [Bacillus]|uniref:DUF58 domain-containing protein n=1 Tax=Bacillus licheniformis TaxID=1402 RepID=UPI0007791019|nr:DUF58 domain-containing protein [Bacillus licheniformis]ATI74943.1 DUF58 domain-containing protein [Bacillus licheniformis]KYC68168.1 hypothetical protein B4092_0733 [Bacillus licheniformis]KYC74433.1 hypothetical protein B4090_0994 [Bacillus licheniformis]MEC2366757.1 DUF58 domain-containing protein [Bacillus licheniformis]MEC3534257.1 DUF58 domain-containing protein [Bacillus licheniformis]
MRERIGLVMYGWKLFILFLLFASTFCYAMFQGGFVSWFLFYSFLPFALYAFLFAFYPLKNLTAERRLSQGQYKAGDQLEAFVVLKRKWPFPIMFMIVEDCLPDSLGKNRGSAEAKQLLFPWFKKEIKMAYTIDSVPRGDHRLAKIRVRTGDPLGLLERECEIQLEASFLVLPSYQEIAYRASGGSYDEHAGRISELRRKDSTLASGIREYQPGDRFAWVDWKTSARRSQLMTKEFEQTKGDDLLVFMDQSPSEAFEEIVTFTASIIRSAMRSGTNAGLVSIGKERNVFPVRQGEEQLRKLFYYLAIADCNAVQPFHSLIEGELGHSDMRKAVKYIVTSRITIELVQALKKPLSGGWPVICLVKKKGGDLSSEESAAVQHLKARGIEVNVIYGEHFSRGLAEAR